MNKIFHKSISLLLLFLSTGLLISCEKKLSESKIDWEKWRLGIKDCNHYRNSTIQELEKILPEIIKMNGTSILRLLGSPNEKNLLKRSQKEFRYSLNPGKNCQEQSQNIKYLWIRFGAIGNVSECLIISE